MTFKESEKFLLSLNVGEGYNDVVVPNELVKEYISTTKRLSILKMGETSYILMVKILIKF